MKIADSILYNCECADGYMGQRCEFKDLDGTYLRESSNQQLGQIWGGRGADRDNNDDDASGIHSVIIRHYCSIGQPFRRGRSDSTLLCRRRREFYRLGF